MIFLGFQMGFRGARWLVWQGYVYNNWKSPFGGRFGLKTAGNARQMATL